MRTYRQVVCGCVVPSGGQTVTVSERIVTKRGRKGRVVDRQKSRYSSAPWSGKVEACLQIAWECLQRTSSTTFLGTDSASGVSSMLTFRLKGPTVEITNGMMEQMRCCMLVQSWRSWLV